MAPVMISLFANTAVSILLLGKRRDDRDPADGESDGSRLRRSQNQGRGADLRLRLRRPVLFLGYYRCSSC